MSKGQILGCRRRKLILHTLTLQFLQVGKSEGLECVGVFVERFIVVYGSSRHHDRGAFWYKRAIREREIFQRLTHQTHWIEQSEWLIH